MQVNKNVVIFIIILVFVVLAANIYFFAQLSRNTPVLISPTPQFKISPAVSATVNPKLPRAKTHIRPTIPPFKNEYKSNEKIWPSYTNTQYNYSFSYPPEFTINPRGKVGNYVDLVGILYEYQNKKYTIMTIGILNTPAPNKQMTVVQQLDSNLYPVTQYIYPYPKTDNKMQVTLTGFVYPSTNLNYTFADIVNRIGLSLQILK